MAPSYDINLRSFGDYKGMLLTATTVVPLK